MRGNLAHIDISVSSPEAAIRFYDAFFTALGYTRTDYDHPDWKGPNPRRASWAMMLPDGSHMGFEVRPSSAEEKDRRYNRYEPGPHHMAFQADSPGQVDQVYKAMVSVDAEVLDPPVDYGGTPGYGKSYYAVFFADPDGFKLEVVYVPKESPPV